MAEFVLAGEKNSSDTRGVTAERTPEACESSWFALFVKPRHERVAATLLGYQNFEPLVPLYRSRRRWSDRTKEIELPLFPCYVFCRFKEQFRVQIEKTPGVIRIVQFAGKIAPVPDGEISAVRRIVASRLGLEPWPGVDLGSEVVIDSGPLAGVSGTVRTVNKQCRLVVAVNILNRSVAVEIDPSWARPAPVNKIVDASQTQAAAPRKTEPPSSGYIVS